MKQYKMMPNGMFFAGSEVLFVHAPCRVFSMTGDWYAECETLNDLHAALKLHHREPGTFFDLDEVWAYVRERPGECQYSGFFLQPKHSTQGVMHGFEV